MTSRGGPDARTVIAARAGHADALDDLVAESLPLVYNLVGRALDGHADVDDVVQEVMLRVVRHLRERGRVDEMVTIDEATCPFPECHPVDVGRGVVLG